MRFCAHCSSTLPALMRSDARYCSARCRVAGNRRKPDFPTELVARDRWVRYSKNKIPLTVEGSTASSMNPITWSTHDDAVVSTAGVGSGFVLNGDGIVCIDIDHCYTDGILAPWAAELLAEFPATYVERSPSGDGLHIWGVATLPFTGRHITFAGHKVEVYGDRRYITITRDPIGHARHLADLDKALAPLI